MHFYHIPDGHASEPEFLKLRSIADEFDRASMDAFDTPANRKALMRVATQEEIGTMQGMMALIKSDDAKANAIELAISLQLIDVQTGMMNRADQPLTQTCVPPAMATQEAADLFHKY